MKKIFLAVLLLLTKSSFAQKVTDYNPSIQRTTSLQYFKPTEAHLFSGDCMPYYHNGTFYLYWLLDEGHHAGLDGLGGHQWALSTSTDLVNWQHHPVALGIDNDEWEKSICTGSVIAEGDKFYAFYATRVKENEKVHEQLSYAISHDGGYTYEKQTPNPFYYAPDVCISRDFRDPKVFKGEDGLFHLLVSGNLKDPILNGFGGYLVHLVSSDLKDWKEIESPLKGQRGTPECADYFKWNDWYYLLYSIAGHTYYVMSQNPYGPWVYPESQTLASHFECVYKTAPFKDGRRIGVAYSPYRKDNKDNEDRIWGGNILFREICQEPNGTLSSKFLPEVQPSASPITDPVIKTPFKSAQVSPEDKMLTITAAGDFGIAEMDALPDNYRISMRIEPNGNYEELGLFLRATDRHMDGYRLELNPNNQTVLMHNSSIQAVKGMKEPFDLEVIVYEDFFDVSIDNKRCLLNRLPEHRGDKLFFYVKNGNAIFRDVKVEALKN
ncbi:family 43 glycosylhydrolase [Sphingobacterium sp. SYP-B4668]|uniref:family 43 glycosylhydrolase n=1 Tax=Sphingobacterium sp. SYP-B4668 TaxID=2996035 RepID=UPI0022DCF48F|nr:family 43 glycosylhydrolase [Sphingobacterium sp. SYP-B4668]